MPDIETYYLIDFENVNEAELLCSNKLGCHDHIHIFSTPNASKISLEVLSCFNSAEHFSHIVPAGKQSLDMHLVSYLGYLIGKNDNNNFKYVIISKDTNYDNVISFLKELNPSNITRQTGIDLTAKKTVQNVASEKDSGAANANADAKAASQAKIQLNTKIQRTLSAAGYDQPTVNSTASIVAKHYNDENVKQSIHRAIVAKYGQQQGLNIYNQIKKIL